MTTRRESLVSLLLMPVAGAALAQTPPLDGRWVRHENGVLAESLEIAVAGTSVQIAFFNPDGSPNGQISGTIGNDLVIARSAQRLVVMTPRDGRLVYASTDHDGSNRWDGFFTR